MLEYLNVNNFSKQIKYADRWNQGIKSVLFLKDSKNDFQEDIEQIKKLDIKIVESLESDISNSYLINDNIDLIVYISKKEIAEKLNSISLGRRGLMKKELFLWCKDENLNKN
jgi:hypothetical protein